MADLRLIVGLGNPGERYEGTLHNAGFWFVDAIANATAGSFRYEKKFDADCCRTTFHGADLMLVKPQSFMNDSGRPVRAVLDYFRYSVDEMLVAHDEIDLPPGTVRLKKGGGHGGHNGLRDIIQHCSKDFLRLRIGVGHPGSKSQVTNYVLKRASSETMRLIEDNIADAKAVLPTLITRGLEVAMTELHTRGNANKASEDNGQKPGKKPDASG